MTKIYFGWWMVAGCALASMVGNALGLFGAGVYLHAAIMANAWSTALVSGAVTLFYVVSAILLIPVGAGIRAHGPRGVIALGGFALACGVAGIGQARAPWQAYLAFLAMGVGWACLSTTAIATTLAPWFEKFQGRAVSMASLGASVGGMIGAPLLLFGIGRIGLSRTTLIAACIALIVLWLLAFLVLRHRPADMGLYPDGGTVAGHRATTAVVDWTRGAALRTMALRSFMLTFGIGMMVQIGFLTHQIALLSRSFSAGAVSVIVSATAVAALLGRIGLARYSDRIDARLTAAIVLLLAAGAFAMIGLFPVPAILAGGSIIFGVTVGNVTTLAPIIVRREFGAPSFGPIFGAASCGIQLLTALGPGFYGMLHDWSGSYSVALLSAATLDAFAAMIIVTSGRPYPR